MKAKFFVLMLFAAMFTNPGFSGAASNYDDKAFFDLCMTGSRDDIELAVKNGANVNAKNEDGLTALMLAASLKHNPDVIAVLIENGSELEAKDEDGKTSLFYAVNTSNVEGTKTLLAFGANPNVWDQKGEPLLFHAITTEDLAILKTLFDYGTDADIRNRQ